MKNNTTTEQRDKRKELNCDKFIWQMTAYTKVTAYNWGIHVSISVGEIFREHT
jgi:hypothetical protein